MKLSELGTLHEVKCKSRHRPYHIEFPDSDHLVLTIGAIVGSRPAGFEHANIAAKAHQVFEFKHESRRGRKWWTAQPGIEFYFVVPKDRIELIEEPGYSYVPVTIGNAPYCISCSGGTDRGGWTDWVRRHASLLLATKIGYMKPVVEAAWTLDECRQHGVTVEARAMDDRERRRWRQLAAKKLLPAQLKSGDKLLLEAGYTCGDSRGPFIIEGRRKTRKGRTAQAYVCRSPGPTKVPFDAIAWRETAEINRLEAPEPVYQNHLPSIQQAVTC